MSIPSLHRLSQSARTHVVLVLTAALVMLSVGLPAKASAEPVYYFMKCRPLTGGSPFKITNVEQCRWGYIYVTNSRDTKTTGIDMWKLEIQMKKGASLSALLKACTSNIVCSTVVGDFVLKKVKAAYYALKVLI